ncbi:MAG: hypothetical protein JW811_10535 [Clostridiales bacterium]|nr:hypothetical protein [Clostridiales bacterium]
MQPSSNGVGHRFIFCGMPQTIGKIGGARQSFRVRPALVMSAGEFQKAVGVEACAVEIAGGRILPLLPAFDAASRDLQASYGVDIPCF